METNGFGKMLGRGFGRLMSQVEKPEELLDTLEKTMVRGADAIRSAVDDPKGTADAVVRHSKAMAEAFKEGYAEMTADADKGADTPAPAQDADARTQTVDREPSAPATDDAAEAGKSDVR